MSQSPSKIFTYLTLAMEILYLVVAFLTSSFLQSELKCVSLIGLIIEQFLNVRRVLDFYLRYPVFVSFSFFCGLDNS